MTPKEKAEELLNKFFNYCSYEWWEGQEGHKENMKKCALIAVDEILNNWKSEATIQYPYGKVINYWNIVKEEIQNL